ncbi:large ribosomal subunit protein bL28m-like [Lineus longissimus]|uniref:large ribosomal subunit protein bL28m-like n=1 Tax=Lineus longissimus TaxID=88925 RepID=UPI002B4DF692
MNKLAANNLKKGFWPWKDGPYSQFPDHYKRRVIEKFTRQPIPVHYVEEPKWKVIPETGERIRNQTPPIPLIFPKEALEGLWGGEGIIRGFIKRHRFARRCPHFWKPRLIKHTLYSEILDQWMPITVTFRTLDLIDQHYGFDNYILKTHEVDLQSNLGMKLKREMIITLSRKSMYPDDPVKREEIYNKYKEFIIPEEEAEWLGLTFSEAVKKLKETAEREKWLREKPLMQEYLKPLIESLQVEEEEEKKRSMKDWISSMFKSKSDVKPGDDKKS